MSQKCPFHADSQGECSACNPVLADIAAQLEAYMDSPESDKDLEDDENNDNQANPGNQP